VKLRHGASLLGGGDSGKKREIRKRQAMHKSMEEGVMVLKERPKPRVPTLSLKTVEMEQDPIG